MRTERTIIYSALWGAYDYKLLTKNEVTGLDTYLKKYKFVLFTNNKRLKSDLWEIVYVDKDPVEGDSHRSSYYYKTLPHKVLPKYGFKNKTSIWVDSSINRLNLEKLYTMCEHFKASGKALYIERHPSRDCVYQELEACIRLSKDNIEAMREHVATYRSEGYPEHNGMVETGAQIRNHYNKDLIKFQEALWNEMITKSRRDQLSWNPIQYRLGFKDYSLFSFQEKTEILWFQDHPNREKHQEKVLLAGPWLGDNHIESSWSDYIRDHVQTIPYDTVIVGCRPNRESLYEDYADKFIISNPEGESNKNLFNGKIPRFNVKISGDKDVTQINPTNDICNQLAIPNSAGCVHFKVFIAGWKCEKYIEKCLKSLLNQKYTNWEAQVLLDPNTDGDKTYEIAKRFESEKLHVAINATNMGSTYNHSKAVEMMSPNDNDVIVCLDADDWFAHDRVFNVVNNAYAEDKELLLTYGSWMDYPVPGELQPNNSKEYTRQEFGNLRFSFFKGTHLRTMKYKIWKNIKPDALQNANGEYYKTACDVARMFPALEMAGFDRIKFIPEVLYIYNRETAFNDDKCKGDQARNHLEISKKTPYPLYEDNSCDCIVFSKDRACQLDACLSSMKKYHKDLDSCDVSILYTYSNDKFKKGYDLLIDKYPEFNFVKETSFKDDLTKIYFGSTNEYVSFFVDDIIWKDTFSFSDKEFVKFKNDKSILALSLRLHSGITYCHPQQQSFDVPPSVTSEYYMWDWISKDGDWGYPMSVDGNIFRKEDINDFITRLDYKNPNTFEAWMANDVHKTQHTMYNTKNHMICYSNNSKLFNIPMNRVQETFNNPSGEISVHELNDKLLNGNIINIDMVDGFVNSACHQEFEIDFRRTVLGKQKFDVFLVCGTKDYVKLPYCVKAIRENIEGVDEIHLCTPSRIDIDGTIWHDEAEVLSIDKSRISHRPNWIYQQMLKLFQNVTTNDYYMTVDADTIINKPLSMFTEDGHPIWYVGWPQNHNQYYVYNKEMFGYDRHVDHTFLADMNFFNKNIINDMLNEFGYTVDSFIEKSYDVIKHNTCYPSEADVYGNYFVKYHPDLYEIKSITTKMDGRQVSDLDDTQAWSEDEIRAKIESMKNVDVNTFSMHSWT